STNGTAPAIVPIAEDDVGGDPVDGGGGAVGAGLPAAVAGGLRIQEPVAPHQHSQFLFVDQVAVQVVDGPREEFGRVLPLAARAVVTADQEDLVHPHVERIRFEGLDQ